MRSNEVPRRDRRVLDPRRRLCRLLRLGDNVNSGEKVAAFVLLCTLLAIPTSALTPEIGQAPSIILMVPFLVYAGWNLILVFAVLFMIMSGKEPGE